MKLSLLGIDLAKRVFQLHGADEHGKTLLKKTLKRDKVASFIANLPKCIIAMEACSSSNYWGRRFSDMGHEVRLIAPQHVTPFRRRSVKDDAADAEAIVEAAARKSTRLVPLKQSWQLDLQFLHRIRQRHIERRNALGYQTRAFLLECGIDIGLGTKKLKATVSLLLATSDDGVLPMLRDELSYFLKEHEEVEAQIDRLDDKIAAIGKGREDCQRLLKIPGVGPLTATAIVAATGNPRNFKNGRQFAAWLGLVPGHSGTGGKVVIGGITKTGDTYLRNLLIHGGRSVVQRAAKYSDRRSLWIEKLVKEKPFNKAAIAVANKNARTIWALLAHGGSFDPAHKTVAA